ncbi:MAG TPA: cytochrome c biogenesis protein CcsA [Polyangiaceae bacterium]|nr:cytochrome c biogenesis protein CcsA [Polyangiaceae bacterium]
MPWLASIAFYLGVIAYSAAATFFFLDLLRPAPHRAGAGPSLLAAGAVSHAAHLVVAGWVSQTCPVGSLHFALGVSAIIAVAAFLAVRRRFRLDAVGSLIAPLALILLLSAEFMSLGPTISGELPRGLLLLHIAANVLGFGLFLLAGASGAVYVFEERRLKRKRLGSLSKLPPLASLDRVAHRLLLVGFPLLTFGVVTGSMFLDQLGHASADTVLRSLLGYLSWFLLALVLLLRRVSGFSGRRAAYGTLAGVTCVLLVVLVYVFRISPG